MTERRPHWSDELIEAVSTAISDYISVEELNPQFVFAVIAAVEDWHKAKRDQRVRTHSAECWRWHQECAEYRIEKLSARVQAVRQLCDDATRDAPRVQPLPGSVTIPVLTVRQVLKALDGDA